MEIYTRLIVKGLILFAVAQGVGILVQKCTEKSLGVLINRGGWWCALCCLIALLLSLGIGGVVVGALWWAWVI